jgi:dihydrofolate reductase
VRTIRIIEHITLDGVVQAPGMPGEDTEGGFAFGGWVAPYHDHATGAAIAAAQGTGFDLLLGRRTYDIFAAYWPHQAGPMADALNRARKHVATHRPDSLGWGPAEALPTDIAAGIARLKAGDGPDLIVWGSSQLTPLLVSRGLADEVLLLGFPVLIGRGKRVFSDTVPPAALALVDSRPTPSGVVLGTYRVAGPLRTGTVGAG